jgi:hypothetical protein
MALGTVYRSGYPGFVQTLVRCSSKIQLKHLDWSCSDPEGKLALFLSSQERLESLRVDRWRSQTEVAIPSLKKLVVCNDFAAMKALLPGGSVERLGLEMSSRVQNLTVPESCRASLQRLVALEVDNIRLVKVFADFIGNVRHLTVRNHQVRSILNEGPLLRLIPWG